MGNPGRTSFIIAVTKEQLGKLLSVALYKIHKKVMRHALLQAIQKNKRLPTIKQG